MVKVAEFATLQEATLAKMSLNGAGIESFIPNDNTVRLRGDLSPALELLQNGVSLEVAEEDAEAAKLWLAQPALPLDDEA
jgi:hypothetical protein